MIGVLYIAVITSVRIVSGTYSVAGKYGYVYFEAQMVAQLGLVQARAQRVKSSSSYSKQLQTNSTLFISVQQYDNSSFSFVCLTPRHHTSSPAALFRYK